MIFGWKYRDWAMFRRACMTVLLILMIGGCQDENSRMTDAELERIALTQKIELERGKGALVLVVSGETVTSDEVVQSSFEYFKPVALAGNFEQFKTKARERLEKIVMTRISNILLYQHAKIEAGGNVDEALEKAAEMDYRRFVLEFGGDPIKAADQLKQRYGATDKKSFIDMRKRSILVQSYLGKKSSANRPVTYRELIDCYNQMKDEHFAIEPRIAFRLIDIQPGRFELTDPNQDRHEIAKDLADKLAERLKSGEDFAELAKQYSHGHRKDFGGLWPPVNPESLAAPYNLIAIEADKIEPGQIAGPLVATWHVFIIKLEEKQLAGYEPFEDVQEQVARQVAINRHNELVNQLNARLKREAEAGSTDEFVDFCLEKIYQMAHPQQ